ncbi:MAG TPA: hypothetical protein VI792_07580 [Candidatus Eisenbacteria bacterium]
MNAARPRRRVAALVLAVALITAGGSARASGPPVEPEPAPPDTALHRFLGALSDSTDRYFGKSAAPLDTTGLDSLEANPPAPSRRIAFGVLPTFDFSRVDGSTFGATVRLEGPARIGRLRLHAAYAVGSEDWLGGAEYRRRVYRHGVAWTLEGWGGRETAPMNRDWHEIFLDAARALVNGSDRTNYLRHDGWRASFERESDSWRAGLGVRDMLESPAATTATWNLLHRDLVVTPNLPAAYGRVREIGIGAGARVPGTAARVQADGWTSGPALSSDLTYDRVRVALGADVTAGRWASVLPQAAWGFVSGNPTPQESFYLGAGPTLGSVPRDALGGTSFALAKLEVIAAGDLLGMVRIPHPALLYLQPAAFVATGAVGGADPYGGPARAGDRWPEPANWLSEAGVSLVYMPGLFGSTVRMSEAWPLGPTTRRERFVFVISHALDLLRRPSLEE